MNTNWMRVTLRITPHAADAAGELLRRAGAAGWESPAADTVVGYLPADHRADERVAALREQVRALAAFGLDPGPGEVVVEVIQERPWEELWKSYFRPTRLGRVVVSPTWEQTELAPGEVLVTLDPGMAFGSGAHATTRLCLLALQEELPAGGRVLDVGTGSGILAIAAARLGASHILALDNDDDVLPIARENAALNGVADRVQIRAGEIDAAPPAERWDVILANIAPDPVMTIASQARDRLVPGGVFIGAGIPATRGQEVGEALGAAGFHVERTPREAEWVAVVARRLDR